MWDIYCDECDRWELIGVRGTVGVVNVEPGVMIVVLRCGRGHTVAVTTGRGVHDPDDRSLRLVG